MPDIKGRKRPGKRHLFIPDTQVKKGVRIDHLERIGKYAAAKRPDIIVHIGDHWDMPSLSSYDKGKKSYEGRRYRHDIDAGNKAIALLEAPILDEIAASVGTDDEWNPRRVFCLGNHEQRIQRAIETEPILEGTIGYHDFALDNWEVYDYKEVVWLDGIAYSHFFANKMSGLPIGGSIENRLNKIGHSFTQGHQQTLMFGCRPTLAGIQYGLVCGTGYQHDEDYRGYQANDEWRGVVLKNQVKHGSYDPCFVSLEWLKWRYPSKPIYA